MYYVAAAAKSLKLCPTLCDPMDCSLPRSSVHGIFQARVLKWVAISFTSITPQFYKTPIRWVQLRVSQDPSQGISWVRLLAHSGCQKNLTSCGFRAFCCSVAQLCLTLQRNGLQPTTLLRPWDSQSKSTGVGCHCLLRAMFILMLQKAQLTSHSRMAGSR